MRACLKNDLKLTGSMMGMIMAQTFGAAVTAGKTVVVVVEVSGLRASDTPDGGARERTLTVRFRMGGSREAARDGG